MALSMNLRRRSRTFAVVAVATVAASTHAACGTSESDADLANGQQKFMASCSACHTLAAAGATGTLGPNLDDAFRQVRSEGFPADSSANVVKYWIHHPGKRFAPPTDAAIYPDMPADLVTGQDAVDVAWYVATSAATGDAANDSTLRKAADRPLPKTRDQIEN